MYTFHQHRNFKIIQYEYKCNYADHQSVKQSVPGLSIVWGHDLGSKCIKNLGCTPRYLDGTFKTE